MPQADINEHPTQESNAVLLYVLKSCTFLLVIGVLIALLILVPTPKAYEAAWRAQCTINIKQIELALYNYHDDYGTLPPAYTTDENGKPLHSWRVLILPYIEHGALYDSIRLDEPWDSEYNKQFHSLMPSIYFCPSSESKPRDGFTSYMGVVGPDTISDGTSTTKFDDVTADLSTVIWLVEVHPSTCWMVPIDIPQSVLSPDLKFSSESGIGSRHPGGIVVGYMDGSARYTGDDEAGELSEKVKIKR